MFRKSCVKSATMNGSFLPVHCTFNHKFIFSSPGRSPGRAIVLPRASAWALAKSLTLKFFMRWARHCQVSYPVPVTGLVYITVGNPNDPNIFF